MKNHFIFSYVGNKRGEVEIIFNQLNLEGIDIIVEPFCGSSALSYYISTIYPNRFIYILNDMNPYIKKLYDILKSEEETNQLIDELKNIYHTHNKTLYLSIVNRNKTYINGKTFIGWMISHLTHAIVVGLFNNNDTIEKIHKRIENIKTAPIVNFLRTENVSIICGDGMDVYIPYSTRENTLIFLDPPYLITDNTQYDCNNQIVYEYLYNNKIENNQSNTILCLEWSWIVQLFFKNPSHIYNKTYGSKKTQHAIIKNRL